MKDIGELKALADKINGAPKKREIKKDRIVAKVQNRDGSLLDVIYGV